MKKFVWIGVLGVLVVLACLVVLRHDSKKTQAVGPLPVGTLATRDHLVSIYSDGGNQTYYSVTSRNGEILGEMLDESALQSEFPDLHKQMKTGIAGQDDDTIIWSELDLPTEMGLPQIRRKGIPFDRVLR